MSSQYVYALLGLTAIVAMLVGVLTYAALRFVAAARDSHQTREIGAETMFLSAALQEAMARLRAQEQAMSARAEASERLSDEIVSSLSDGLLVVDGSGAIQILNPSGRELLGLPEGASQARYQELLGDGSPIATAIDECLGTGRPVPRRTVTLPEGGRVSHLGVSVSPLRRGDDSQGAICLFTDLTDVTRLESQLRLKDTLARLGELTAGIAHEFRNGLATIHGYGRLMLPEQMPEAYRPYVVGIREEAEALGRVVTNFLNFARPEQVVMAPVELGGLVTRAVEELRRDTPDAELEVTGAFGTVEGDDVLLRQMVVNLVRNALDACADAGRPMRVTVDGTLDGGAGLCRLTVHDAGPGIDPSLAERVFRPFFTTRPKGTGLGLAIVQKVAVTHNGRVEVARSPLLGGAALVVTLPLATPFQKRYEP